MATFQLVKFTHMSPMHIGLGRDSYDVAAPALHSDTIIAALAALRAQSGNADGIKALMEQVAVSSAFPYAGGELFLPKPCGRLGVKVRKQSEKQYRKRLKKVRFVSRGLWQSIVAGNSVDVEENQLHGQFLLQASADSFTAPMVHATRQRVQVGAEDAAAEPFTFDWTFFRPGCGLYCLLSCPDEMLGEVKSLFALLGEEGIGSDRTVGGGHFEVEFGTVDLMDVAGANATMLLSMCLPTEDDLKDIDLEQSRFELVQRGGFMAGSSVDGYRHLRKKSIMMLAPGAVLSGVHELSGKVADLRPDTTDGEVHPVYRGGRPICFPIKTN